MTTRYFFLLFILATFPFSSLGLSQWHQTNGPWGGNFQCFAVSPNGMNMLAGNYDALLCSTDAGATWSRANGGPSSYPLYAALLFTSDTEVFTGTSSGVYRSTDGGKNWIWCGFDDLVVSLGEVKNGAGNNVLFAGTYEHGMFQSTNNGATWTPLLAQIEPSGFPQFVLNHANSFASYPYAVGKAYLFVASDYGVLRSTDDGAHWTYLDTVMQFGRPQALVVMQGAGGVNALYAGDWYRGVFRSVDNGTTWSPVNEGLWDTNVQALVLSYDQGGARTLIAGTGGSGIFRSQDDGATWAWASEGLSQPGISALAVHPLSSGDDEVFAVTVGGIFRSTDQAETWKQLPGIVHAGVDALAFSPTGVGGTAMFAGSYGAGVSRSTDAGSSWEVVTPVWSWNVQSLIACPVAGGGMLLYAGTGNNGIFRSSDNGSPWEQVNNGLSGSDVRTFAYASGSHGDTLLFAGTYGDGVFRSIDHGMNWARVNEGLDLDWHVGSLALATDPGGVRHLFASTQKVVYHTANDGTNWAPTSLGAVTVLAARTTSTGVVELFAGSGSQVFRSTDLGGSGTWTTVGTPSGRISSLLVDGEDNLFAGTTEGEVYLSTDSGGSWRLISTGLPKARVEALARSGDNFFVGMNGVWYRPLSEILSVEKSSSAVPEAFALEQNYPNPFNPSTRIKYTVGGARNQGPGASQVRLVVYDLLGREIAVLVNERKSPGTHEVSFDGSGLASGAYIYRLQAGNFVQTRKLLLIR